MPGGLLLLNGPPGIGKSTVARLLVESRPLALCLDVDLLRRSLGGWMEQPEESGRLARDLTIAAAAQHLRAGHAGVVPQYLGKLGFIERLERLAAEHSASFLHVVLLDAKGSAASRFLARHEAPGATEQHQEAAAMGGGEAGFGELYDALLGVVGARPDAIVVAGTARDAVRTCADVAAAVDGRW